MRSPLVSAGFVRVFDTMGIASRVNQKKMIAVHSQAQRSGGAQPDKHLEQVYLGSME